MRSKRIVLSALALFGAAAAACSGDAVRSREWVAQSNSALVSTAIDLADNVGGPNHQFRANSAAAYGGGVYAITNYGADRGAVRLKPNGDLAALVRVNPGFSPALAVGGAGFRTCLGGRG